jgi:hypothetical protein
MVRLVRHCQTKETETDRPNLNHYASSLLYLAPPSVLSPEKEQKKLVFSFILVVSSF